MTEIIAIWTFLRELGQVANLAIVVAVYFIWKNDLRHIGEDIKWVKGALLKHLEWHSERDKP